MDHPNLLDHLDILDRLEKSVQNCDVRAALHSCHVLMMPSSRMFVVSYHVGVRIEHVRWMSVDKENVTKKRIHESSSE